ncbi:MAG TPA: hypothetical protein VFF89_06365, partial [Sphingobium sp.]|nr:hypothetical protein [Sphingobium sp.]
MRRPGLSHPQAGAVARSSALTIEMRDAPPEGRAPGCRVMLNNRPVFVLLGLGMLGACGDGGRQTAESDKDGGFAMRVEHDMGEAANVSIDLPAVKGRFTLP